MHYNATEYKALLERNTTMEPGAAEFEIGEEVTYKPYDEEVKLVVLDVRNRDIWGNRSLLPVYHLGYQDCSATSITTGRYIVESLHYKEGV